MMTSTLVMVAAGITVLLVVEVLVNVFLPSVCWTLLAFQERGENDEGAGLPSQVL